MTVFVNFSINISFKCISFVAFLRVQWEPFETRFGKISSSFRYHLGVLDHSVQALQYNAIQDGNCAAEIERQRMQQKESGMICSSSLPV